jgi:hypothetical protein
MAACGELAHQPQVGGLIRVRGEQTIDLHENVLGLRLARGQQLLEIRLGLVDALHGRQIHGHHLQRGRRVWLGFVPELRRLERELRHAREVCDFHRAPRDSRVARALGKVDVGLGRQLGVAALNGDLADQQFIQDRLGQLFVWQPLRRLGGDRLRARQRAREQQRGRQDKLPQNRGHCDHFPS